MRGVLQDVRAKMEDRARIELATSGLKGRGSTAELPVCEEKGATHAEAQVAQLPRAVANGDRGEDTPLRVATRGKR